MTREWEIGALKSAPSTMIARAALRGGPGPGSGAARGASAARSRYAKAIAGAPMRKSAIAGAGDDLRAKLRRRAVVEARSWIGTPYRHQASAKGAGADCLGLLRGVWRALYDAEPETPPPYTPDWTERVRAEPLLDAARRHLVARGDLFAAGDVLLFRVSPGGPVKHCAIATSGERMIHAYAGRAVVEGPVSLWWRRRLAGVFSFPGAE